MPFVEYSHKLCSLGRPTDWPPAGSLSHLIGHLVSRFNQHKAGRFTFPKDTFGGFNVQMSSCFGLLYLLFQLYVVLLGSVYSREVVGCCVTMLLHYIHCFILNKNIDFTLIYKKGNTLSYSSIH